MKTIILILAAMLFATCLDADGQCLPCRGRCEALIENRP